MPMAARDAAVAVEPQTDHPQFSLAQVTDHVVPSGLARAPLKRGPEDSRGVGELARLWNGGMAMNVDG